MHTARFLNNLRQRRSKSNDWKAKSFQVFKRASRLKGLNIMAKTRIYALVYKVSHLSLFHCYFSLGYLLVFSGFRVTRSLVLYVCFVDRCLSFCTFAWPLRCLFFFDIRVQIAPLVSSNSSYIILSLQVRLFI